MFYAALSVLSFVSLVLGADPGAPKASKAPEGPAKQVLSYGGPQQPQFYPELQYNFNLLEPQFQYPAFNYVPDKQHFPGVQQPPIIFYAGAAPPGQQFLVRPGAPPGNFLVPQPQPQPHPGIIYSGHPQQGPAFVAGYPRPAHIPPVEKDAEEIPHLAGNHPVTRRPFARPNSIGGGRPERLETLDEPQPPTTSSETETPSTPDNNKNPNVFPKKSTPTRPALKPGQRFFILNGNPLFSNYPFEGVAATHPHITPNLQHVNPDLFYYREPQYNHQPQPHQYEQLPVQDLFLRNSITGEISNVKQGPPQQPQFRQENFVSLNQPEDFRQNFLFRNVEIASQQPNAPVLLRGFPTSRPEAVVKADQEQTRHAKEIQLRQQTFGQIYGDNFYPGPVGTFGGYYNSDFKNNGKDEDDTVVIDAKEQSQNDAESEEISASKSENPSLSQAEPAAIALAGIGGVASAGPRGTALTGERGLAVARPIATAVAGPTNDETENKTKQKKSPSRRQ